MIIKPEIKKIYSKVEALLQLPPKNLKSLKRELDAINKYAELNLPEEDAIVIYASTSTFYNSFIYWFENSNKWIVGLNNPELFERYTDDELNQFNTNETQTKSWWNSVAEAWNTSKDAVNRWWDNGGKDLVGEDSAGALSGAIIGGSAGSFVSGVGALPGAGVGALTGAAANSIEEAFDQFWK